MIDKHRGWIASLDNGETIFESQLPINGMSNWQNLLIECRKSGIKITMMRLQRGGVTVMAAKDADGYMQAYEAKVTYHGGKGYLVQGIGSVFGDAVFITWLNDQGSIWQDVRPLKSVAPHTYIGI